VLLKVEKNYFKANICATSSLAKKNN